MHDCHYFNYTRYTYTLLCISNSMILETSSAYNQKEDVDIAAVPRKYSPDATLATKFHRNVFVNPWQVLKV